MSTSAEKTGDVDDLIDGVGGIEILRHSAAELDAWQESSGTRPRPTGRLRMHRPEPVGRWAALWAQPIHRTFVDPDGRPRSLRRTGRF